MNEESGSRLVLDKGNITGIYVYRPPNVSNPYKPEAQNATIGVKFAQGVRILDPWHLIGGTKWSRAMFRIKHPIVYGKRGLRQLYRKIRKLFIKDRMIQCMPMQRIWVSKEDVLEQYPEGKKNV
jgi:hypothetical protein